MRKNFGPKSWLYPMPVLIIATYNEDKTADAMNAAWGAISQSNHISICVSAGHKTTQNILARKAFTVSMADAAHVVACDYVGVVSGNNEPNKMEKAGFHTTPSEFVDAPVIDELPLLTAVWSATMKQPDVWWARLSTSAQKRRFCQRTAKSTRRNGSQSPLTRSTAPIWFWEKRSEMPSRTV